MSAGMHLLLSPFYLAAIGAAVALVALGRAEHEARALASHRAGAVPVVAPNALYVLLCSILGPLLIVFLYTHARPFGIDPKGVLIDGGPLRNFTILADLTAAALLAIAAYRNWRRAAPEMFAAVALGGCALLLFVHGMEQIGWALWDGEAGPAGARITAYTFTAGALLLTGLNAYVQHPAIKAVAPHPSLLPLSLIIGYAGFKLHPEIVRAFVALYFILYSYRAFRLSRACAPMGTSSAVERRREQKRELAPSHAALTPLYECDGEGWRHSEILDYTHDAIILWELDGDGVVYWNRAAEEMYGYTREEAARTTTHALLRTQLPGGVQELEAKLSRYGVWAGELTHTSKAGAKVVVQSRIALMAQRNGRWLVLEVNRALTSEPSAAVQSAMESHLRRLRSLRALV